MEIKKKYFQKYLHEIAIEQIAEEYRKKNYQVSLNVKLGKYEADLIARNKNESIVIEVKTGKMTPDRKHKIAELGNYVQQLGNYKFLVAIATPPKEKKLEIAEIEDLLTDYMMKDLPYELDELSTHTRFEQVTDIDIDEISIRKNQIFVVGDGVVSVELQFGSDGDQNSGDGFKHKDNFPFDFKIKLEFDDRKHKLVIAEVDKIEIDTSSYNE